MLLFYRVTNVQKAVLSFHMHVCVKINFMLSERVCVCVLLMLYVLACLSAREEFESTEHFTPQHSEF